MSIAASGYFDHEPLFVAREQGKDVVIEGNRRLAAVKLLLDANARTDLHATDLPKITDERAASLGKLPIIRMDRRDAWQYLGFKHVNGPARWDSYPKAQYIATVHNDYKIRLDEIARQIGDKHGTVQRLYRALMVIEQAEQSGGSSERIVTGGTFHFHTSILVSTTRELPPFYVFGPSRRSRDRPFQKTELSNLVNCARGSTEIRRSISHPRSRARIPIFANLMRY